MRWNINRFFNPENRFWAFMERVTDICVLSFFWFLFSIPAVTVGAATTALFQYTLRLTADEEGYVWKTFREGFKKNFVQATILWIGAVLAGAFLVFDLWCCQFLAPLGAIRFIAFFLLTGAIFCLFINNNLSLSASCFLSCRYLESDKGFLCHVCRKSSRFHNNPCNIWNYSSYYVFLPHAFYVLVRTGKLCGFLFLSFYFL